MAESEEKVAHIIRENPKILLKRGTYRMPLLNADGTPSEESEQIYHNATPLELLLYTGDI